MRTGTEYVASLCDGRDVFIDGRRVDDVATHPAFVGIVATVGQLYDTAAGTPEMHIGDPDHGTINRVHMTPRSIEDLRIRREAITRWARLSNGFLGRSPDHVGSFFAGFASAPALFDECRDGFGENVRRAYAEIVRDDLYASYTVIPPQNSGLNPGAATTSGVTQVGVVAETDAGIVVQGTQMLATGSAISDRLFVSCLRPLSPGQEDFAVSFMIPVATRGLKLFCRRPYAVGQPSAFDYPLSSRFDESDAMAVFDRVFVPWENVFIYRSVGGVHDQFHRTAAHVLANTQAQIRLTVKLKFLLGLAVHVSEANERSVAPSVQDKLGELASLASVVEGMVLAAEASAALDEFGVCKPNPRFLYGIMGLQSELYPRVLHIIRELSGAGVIGTTSSYRDLVSPETHGDLTRYMAKSEADLEQRMKLFKLVWDAIGSEFAGRHHQYEIFYAGASEVARGYSRRQYGLDEPMALAQEFLDGYDVLGAAGDPQLAPMA
jgi:4-hydroxyphenylacetate 3-monooxygenase